MGNRDLFIDTSGLFAILCPTDPAHPKAVEILTRASHEKRGAVISDYIIDETATLLMARKTPHLAGDLFSMLERTKALRMLFIGSDCFEQARDLFIKHIDQRFSFTDCTSFVLLRETKLRQVLTTDSHFREMGFEALLV